MKAIVHKSTNVVFGPPPAEGDQVIDCDSLPATRGVFGGKAGIVSFWTPDADELAALNAGGSIALCILGGVMPVVSLAIEPADDGAKSSH